MIEARPGPRDGVTDVAGIAVGHHHRIDDDATVAADDTAGTGWATGTTVVLTPPGTIAAVDGRGGAPGTRETDLLKSVNTVQTAHAIVLSGGSAYGLAAADGVMTSLEARGTGLMMDRLGHVVPIVPGAVIFDLPVGGWGNRPDAGFGARAVAAADAQPDRGSVGAGAGARAGALKGGVGTASLVIESGPAAGITVGAVMVANQVGAVLDPNTGLPWGATEAELEYFGLTAPSPADIARYAALVNKAAVLNTTIGVVATDATLDPASTQRVAIAAHDGMARAIRPAHTPMDGDTIFVLATGTKAGVAVPIPPGLNPDVAVIAAVGDAAATVTHRAIVNAVIAATPVAGIPTLTQTLPSSVRIKAKGAR